MSLSIIIGRNKSGKSTYLKQEYNNIDDEVLFIPSDNDLNEMTTKENLGTQVNPKFSPHKKIFNFINEILFGNKFRKKIKDLENFKEIIETRNNITNFNKKISNNEDYYFENYFKQFLNVDHIKEDLEIELKYDFLKWPKSPQKSTKLNEKSISESSSGSLNYSLLKFLYEIFQNEDIKIDGKYKLVIDEVEKFSHPEMIFKIAKIIIEISNKIDVILTTHSPLFLERILFLYKSKNKIKQKAIVNFIIKSKINNEYKSFQIDDEKMLKIVEKSNYRDLSKLSKILFSSNIFLIEGLNDYTLLEDIINQNNNGLNDIYYTIVDCEGKGNIEKILKTIIDLNILSFYRICLFYDLDRKKEIKIEDKHKKNLFSIINDPNIEERFFEVKRNFRKNKSDEVFLLIKSNPGTRNKNSVKDDFTCDWISKNSTKNNVTENIEKIKKDVFNFLKKDKLN